MLKNSWAQRRPIEEQAVSLLLTLQQHSLPSNAKKMQNLIRKAHFVSKAFYGPWPLLRSTYFFHQSHQNLRRGCCSESPGEHPGSFLLYKFFTMVLLAGVDFHTIRTQPDPPRPSTTLSTRAMMKENSTPRLLLLSPSPCITSSVQKRVSGQTNGYFRTPVTL